MRTVLQEVGYGLRALRRSPGHTAAAVLCLGLGIGATSAVFSVLHAVLVRPLPFDDPERLVHVRATNRDHGWDRAACSPADFLDWRAQSRSFEHLAAFRFWFYTLSGRTDPEQVHGWRVSADIFPRLGIEAIRGRIFGPTATRPSQDRVALLSFGLRCRCAPPALLGIVLHQGSPSFLRAVAV